MLTFSQFPNKTQPKKIHQWRDLSERKPIRRSGGFDKWVRRSGGFDKWVRQSGGFISVVRLARCEWVRRQSGASGFENDGEMISSVVQRSLYSLFFLSLSLSLRMVQKWQDNLDDR